MILVAAIAAASVLRVDPAATGSGTPPANIITEP